MWLGPKLRLTRVQGKVRFQNVLTSRLGESCALSKDGGFAVVCKTNQVWPSSWDRSLFKTLSIPVLWEAVRGPDRQMRESTTSWKKKCGAFMLVLV